MSTVSVEESEQVKKHFTDSKEKKKSVVKHDKTSNRKENFINDKLSGLVG